MTRRQSSRCSTRCSRRLLQHSDRSERRPGCEEEVHVKQMAAYCIKHSEGKETARNHRNPSLRNRRKKKYWSNNAPLKASEAHVTQR
ncbi:hypothetical protein L596_013527 [Steinernema carpocapsae]|uniref:Uncharacterized protein n=1 Tax=Steinernema carpocapsae TaxID=34508 RepID=A0A4U5P0K1_STECR|nr:hypothetical protein L596_013527 [Steinernema carpocapsae]